MSWIPLHLYSQYSILNSSASIEDIVAKAKEYGLSSLALTDQGNLYGAVEFFKECKGAGINPIIGCELCVAPGHRSEKKKIPGKPAGFPIILLVKNVTGYRNLCRLSSIAYLEGFYYYPRIDKELLSQYAEGLICLSGSMKGRIGDLILQEEEKQLSDEIQWYSDLFREDFFFEVQRHVMTEAEIIADGMEKESWLLQSYRELVRDQEKILKRIKQLTGEWGIKAVATQGSRYIHRDDWKAHEILMNVQSGEPVEIWEKDSSGGLKARVLNPKREVYPAHVLYFISPQEMQELFSDFPEAIGTTAEIAQCCSFEFDFKAKYYPIFVPPHLEGVSLSPEERLKSAEDFLRALCEEGIPKRYHSRALEEVAKKYPTRNPLEVVRERLSYELDMITSKGMSDYLLIVYDFIAWAKSQKIPMGPGRGSGAGSIILYLIGITDIEPLRFHLFFERFINPERISYPDIDVDICMERRSEVIDYTVRKYGKERVAQIITFGTMKAKMAIKDVGRVLSVPLAKVNIIAKLVPEDPTMTLERALKLDPELRRLCEMDEEVREIIDIAKKLEGSVRNTGIHAAGLIIGAKPIVELIPLCSAKDSEMAVTQFSMKPVEAVGMLKIDFLGLKTLTSLQKAVDYIKLNRGISIDWACLALENKATFELLNQGKTLGIFQLESGGMQELAKHLHIDKFEEIIAVGALYRPGPMEMIPSFINRKHGKETIEIDHPFMADILAETYGIMVYQEQVMQIAVKLANFSLGEGDVLRRAMGKKDREEMARQRDKFRRGSLENGIDEETSMRIFDKIEKFASYGFNKSHAAAYGYLTYATAFLKANFPVEWMASLMTSDRDDITKVARIVRECLSSGIAILPPDINESDKEFMATSQGIRFAMTAIKGIGEAVVDAILYERKKNGPFASLYDFLKRIDTKKVGKKALEVFIEAGCFDFTDWSREALTVSIEGMYESAVREQKERQQGVINLFSLLEDEKTHPFNTPPLVKEKMDKQQRLKREKELMGLYLTGHPLDEYRSLISKLSCVSLTQVSQLPHQAVFRSAFIIESAEVKVTSKTQRKFAVLTISDGDESFELPIWPDLFEEKQALIHENQLIYAVIQVEITEEERKLQCRWLDDLTRVNESMMRSCDAAYDRAKTQFKSFPKRPEKTHALIKSEQVQKQVSMITIKLNIDAVSLSQILLLKKLFRLYPGSTSIQMEFCSEDSLIGLLSIESKWGVQYNREFQEKLYKFPFIQRG